MEKRRKGRWWSRRRLIGLLSTLLLGMGACSLVVPPQGKTVFRVKTEEKVVALTFDDGPNPAATERLLDILRERQVSATFFLTGEHVEAHPQLAERIVREGHEVGNHSQDGRSLAFRSRRDVAERIGRTDEALRKIGWREKALFRPPGGVQGWAAGSLLAKQSRVAVMASVWAWDWKHQDSARIRETVVERARPGSIILLHDGDAARDGADRSGTVAAVPGIIEDLRSRGFRFATVSQLLALERAR